MASSLSTINVDQLVAELQKAYLSYSRKPGDVSTYDHMLAAIGRLQSAVEKPSDMALRFRYQMLVNITISMLAEAGVLRVLVIRGIEGQSVTADQLAKEAGSERDTTRRLLRLLAAAGLARRILEPENYVNGTVNGATENYLPSPQLVALAEPGQVAGVRCMLKLHGGVGGDAARYTREVVMGKEKISMTAVQHAFGMPFWDLVASDAELRDNFNAYMRAEAKAGSALQHPPTWAEAWPPSVALSSGNQQAGDVLLVDVGGGAGDARGPAARFRREFSQLPGRVIVQDLQQTMAEADSGDTSSLSATALSAVSVERMVHDFFQPQPIKGARIYYLRHVCHDWPDADSIKILRNTADGMDSERSTLLVDEVVVPERNDDIHCSPRNELRAASMDVQMMFLCGSMERTERQWRALLQSAGLEVVQVYPSPAGGNGAIIEARKTHRDR